MQNQIMIHLFSYLLVSSLFTAINGLKRRLILKAMDQWSSETCLRFTQVPKVHLNEKLKGHNRNNKNNEFTYWLNFRADSTGCYSFVGRDENCFRQGQPVSISHGCDSVGDQLFHSSCPSYQLILLSSLSIGINCYT